jgi:hypothetical protein
VRTIKLHATVGYELPQHRASCRHCTELDGSYDDRPGFSGTGRWTCKEHGFDVQLGAVCPDFDWKGASYRRCHQPGERDDKTADMFVRQAA